jgi:hypothetical protein
MISESTMLRCIANCLETSQFYVGKAIEHPLIGGTIAPTSWPTDWRPLFQCVAGAADPREYTLLFATICRDLPDFSGAR